ncbi:hypothetical protein ACFL5K_02865 [Gemmatimonadota bacterium]
MKSKSLLFPVFLILALATSLVFLACAELPDNETASKKEDRMKELIDFLSSTVHAGQVAIGIEGDSDYDTMLFNPDGLTLEELKTTAALADSMISLGTEQLKAWVERGEENRSVAHLLSSAADAPKPTAVALPYSVFRNFLIEMAGDQDRNSIPAVANTIQLITQVDRDGDLVQEMISLYQELGLKLSLTSLGLDGSMDNLQAIAEVLISRTGATPFDMEMIDWQLYLHKLEMWDAKISGRRDKKIIADEMIEADPLVTGMLDDLKMLPAKRVAFMGHSLTMSMHWSTYASWSDIAGEIMSAVNQNYEYSAFNSGGLAPVKALNRGHLDDLVAYSPTETFILMMIRDDEKQIAALDSIVGAVKKVGSKCYLVDGVRPWRFRDKGEMESYRKRMRAYCGKKDLVLLEFCNLWEKEQADTSGWRPLKQDIHMCTPGHVFYAKELLKFWLEQSRER